MKSKLVKTFRPVYYKFPILRPIMAFFHRKFLTETKFSGFGMKTSHDLPWNDEYDWEVFRKASIDVKKNFEFSKDAAQIDQNNVDELKWRHWIVAYCVRHAIRLANTSEYNFAECGVGDGVSAFFSLREILGQKNFSKKFSMHLYDSWMAMKGEVLLESEMPHAGKYANLSVEKTKRNLAEFKDNVVYHQGYVPESFMTPPSSPNSIVYLHIDLNSAKPTIDTLEFFLPKLVRGGVILFDDYGWTGFVDTKLAVDAFFKDKPGVLMKLPTGQAIYYG
jgi:hypothetical protein